MSTSSKDCQKCRTRRIKCDRSLPTCLKCASRSFECPGYSRRIKFVFGPSIKKPKAYSKPSKQFSRATAITTYQDPATSILQCEPILRTSLFSTSAAIRNGPDPFMSLTAGDNYPPNERKLARSRLFHHFTTFIAAQLVWVDNHQNPWRRFICPLAAKSACVFYAVLATAAANIHVKLDSNSPGKAIFLNRLTEYRQKALLFLTDHLAQARRYNDREDAEVKIQGFRESLATTILLWHLEMHFPLDSAWKIHLRTAQALIYSHRLTSALHMQFDECETFLLQEFYCATIWPRLTLNIEVQDAALTLPLGNGGDAFIGFVRLMHRLILLTTRKKGDIDTESTKVAFRITELESEASEIRQSVLKILAKSELAYSGYQYDDMLHVVDAWFYAILIFGYQVIGPTCEMGDFIQSDCDCLFQALESLSTPLSFAQNQPWPLFIAGTECAGDKHRQTWIESRFHALIQNICPLDRPRMLEFLKEWWNDHDAGNGYGRPGCWLEFIHKAQSHQDFIIW